jgi:hypothetical protein
LTKILEKPCWFNNSKCFSRVLSFGMVNVERIKHFVSFSLLKTKRSIYVLSLSNSILVSLFTMSKDQTQAYAW